MTYPVTISGEYICTLVTSPIKSSIRLGTVPPRFLSNDFSEMTNRGFPSTFQDTSHDLRLAPPATETSVSAPPRPRRASSSTTNRANMCNLAVEVGDGVLEAHGTKVARRSLRHKRDAGRGEAARGGGVAGNRHRARPVFSQLVSSPRHGPEAVRRGSRWRFAEPRARGRCRTSRPGTRASWRGAAGFEAPLALRGRAASSRRLRVNLRFARGFAFGQEGAAQASRCRPTNTDARSAGTGSISFRR